jgi:hypothetical protein
LINVDIDLKNAEFFGVPKYSELEPNYLLAEEIETLRTGLTILNSRKICPAQYHWPDVDFPLALNQTWPPRIKLGLPEKDAREFLSGFMASGSPQQFILNKRRLRYAWD